MKKEEASALYDKHERLDAVLRGSLWDQLDDPMTKHALFLSQDALRRTADGRWDVNSRGRPHGINGLTRGKPR